MTVRTITPTIVLQERHMIDGTMTPWTTFLQPLEARLSGTLASAPTWSLSAVVDASATWETTAPLNLEPRPRPLAGDNYVAPTLVDARLVATSDGGSVGTGVTEPAPPRADSFLRWVAEERRAAAARLRDVVGTDTLDDVVGVVDESTMLSRRLVLTTAAERSDGLVELQAESVDALLVDLIVDKETTPAGTTAGARLTYLAGLVGAVANTSTPSATAIERTPLRAGESQWQAAEADFEGAGLQIVAGIDTPERLEVYSADHELSKPPAGLPPAIAWTITRSRAEGWASTVVARNPTPAPAEMITSDYGKTSVPIGTRATIVDAPAKASNTALLAYARTIAREKSRFGTRLSAEFPHPLDPSLLGKHVTVPLSPLGARQTIAVRPLALDSTIAPPAPRRNFERNVAGRIVEMHVDLVAGTTELTIELQEA